MVKKFTSKNLQFSLKENKTTPITNTTITERKHIRKVFFLWKVNWNDGIFYIWEMVQMNFDKMPAIWKFPRSLTAEKEISSDETSEMSKIR